MPTEQQSKIKVTNPWEEDSNILDHYYPSCTDKKNNYILFSAAIDRFLIVEKYNPFILLETAHVLSSKIAPVVYVLPKEGIWKECWPVIDNKNCLLFSIPHKKNSVKATSGIDARQHAVIEILNTKIYKPGWPTHFLQNKEKTILLKLQEYSLFCLRVMHAINLSLSFNDMYEEKDINERYYLENFFHGSYDNRFRPFSKDGLNKKSILILIKKILYDSFSIEEALSAIIEAWKQQSVEDLTDRRKDFFNIIGIKQPKELENFTLPLEKHIRPDWAF